MALGRKEEHPPVRLGQVLDAAPPGDIRAFVAASLLSTEQLARNCKVARQTVVRWVVEGCPALGRRSGEPLRFEFDRVEAWRKGSDRT
jgi:hypothetical protein